MKRVLGLRIWKVLDALTGLCAREGRPRIYTLTTDTIGYQFGNVELVMNVAYEGSSDYVTVIYEKDIMFAVLSKDGVALDLLLVPESK